MPKGKTPSKKAPPSKPLSPIKKLVGKVIKAVQKPVAPKALPPKVATPAKKAAAPKKGAAERKPMKDSPATSNAAAKKSQAQGQVSKDLAKAIEKGPRGPQVMGEGSGERIVTSTVTQDLLQKSLQFNSQGEAICREVACESLAIVGGYCRLHYIKNWKKIKRKEAILKERKLNRYIEELVAKYPDKYIEAIRSDLANDKDFHKVIRDLELDEGVEDLENEQENAESLLEGIRRDMDEEDDLY